MDGDPRVRQLLEELLDSEQTPEEVCHHCPELLPEVHRRWQRKRACDAQLDALFLAMEPHSPFGSPSSTPPSAELPRIPGYEVLEVVGRGGMGVVYRARHVRLDRPVALKMLLTGAHASRESRERFLREARIGAGLRHPNFVQVHDMGDQDGLPYFTMEFVEGGNLAQKLAGMPQPPRQAAALLATLAEAVQAAHRCGIVHRDLKPANVLLTADGTPKICDLGLARRLDGEAGLTWTGTAVGTPSYMAPEQAEARPQTLGPAVDIHALGAILYELLTGRPPFRAADGGGDRPPGDLPGSGAAVAAQRQGPPRPGGHLPQVPAQGAAPPLRRRRGAGGGPSPLPGWGGDRGATGGPAGAAGPAGPSAARAIDVGRGRHALDGRPARGRSVADLRSGGGRAED